MACIVMAQGWGKVFAWFINMANDFTAHTNNRAVIRHLLRHVFRQMLSHVFI